MIDTDLPVALGGAGSGPTPGVLLRAALGSCLAMGYRLRAARTGVPLQAVTVVVECDSAVEGMLRAGTEAPPGFTQIRCHVEIVSDAASGLVGAMVDQADCLSPMLDVVERSNPSIRSLSVVAGDR